jgi:hypothetical protein
MVLLRSISRWATRVSYCLNILLSAVLTLLPAVVMGKAQLGSFGPSSARLPAAHPLSEQVPGNPASTSPTPLS